MGLIELAARFAPIVYFHPEEKYMPTNVDWLLARTTLAICDGSTGALAIERVKSAPSQLDLLSRKHTLASGQEISSEGTRSDRKRCTFFLEDLAEDQRGGSPTPFDWTTYVHAYDNEFGGLTIQYWRLHAYNQGLSVPLPNPLKGFSTGFHGGDWEGLSVVLDGSKSPLLLYLMGHTQIEEVVWGGTELEGDHPVVFCERGGHATKSSGTKNGVRQETWGSAFGGRVQTPTGESLDAGSLLDVGTKLLPLNEQVFIQYSGLWGSPSSFPLLGSDPYYISSGYWGPAFNETQIAEDGFITAWGKGAATPQASNDTIREFYATDRSP